MESVSEQHGEVVVGGAGHPNLDDADGAPICPPRLQGTQTEDWEALVARLIGSITREAGGTNLKPAIHPRTGCNKYDADSKEDNILMWTSGQWSPLYRSTE